jgi:hypothetical protein
MEREDELQWGEGSAVSLNDGGSKPEEMKPRNRQDEGTGAKIGPESTWLTHANLLLGARRQTSI